MIQKQIKDVGKFRKIIQISTCSVKISEDSIEQSIIALCEDGSLWDGTWDGIEWEESFTWEELPAIKL